MDWKGARHSAQAFESLKLININRLQLASYPQAYRLRHSLGEKLNAATDPVAVLKAVASERRGDADLRAVQDAIISCFIASRALRPADESLRLVKKAMVLFDRLTKVDARFRAFEKDAAMIAGNLSLALGRDDEALRYYQDAVEGERLPPRRALGRLNIARLHLNRGELYEAWAGIRSYDLSSDNGWRAFPYLLLLKVRILLVLGFYAHAATALKPISAKGSGLEPKASLELRYLGLCARMDFAAPEKFLRRFDDFRVWVDAKFDEEISAFYELEATLYGRCIDRGARRHRSGTAARVALLTRKAGDQTFEQILDPLDRILGKKPTAEACDRFRAAVGGLQSDASHHLYRNIVLLAAMTLSAKRNPDLASALLNDLDAMSARLQAGFPESTLRVFRSWPNAPQNFATLLRTRLPKLGLDDDTRWFDQS